MLIFKGNSLGVFLFAGGIMIAGCATHQSPTAMANDLKASPLKPVCDPEQSKIDYQTCVSLNKSENQIKLENSNVIEHGSPQMLDSKINSTE